MDNIVNIIFSIIQNFNTQDGNITKDSSTLTSPCILYTLNNIVTTNAQSVRSMEITDLKVDIFK